MKDKFYIFPLLSVTIGAFFLGLHYNLVLFIVLLLFIAIFHFHLFKEVTKILLFLLLFTFPIFLAKVFFVKEGRVIHFLGFKFYLHTLIYVLNMLIRIWILALSSFVLVKIIFRMKNLEKYKSKNFILKTFFESVYIYEELMLEFWKNIKKKGLRFNIINWLDKAYKSKIKYL